ncbi:hypothetical protein HanIR_Chr09g0403581 [Helianthus annuus]|nr:hypothetical protein HanIR_Chr09g0403581 [Helianthus annuus]
MYSFSFSTYIYIISFLRFALTELSLTWHLTVECWCIVMSIYHHNHKYALLLLCFIYHNQNHLLLFYEKNFEFIVCNICK